MTIELHVHIHQPPDPRIDQILTTLNAINQQEQTIMSDQSHLDTDIAGIGAQFATVIAELKASHAAGTPLDFTAADALVATVTTEATADAPAPAVTPTPPATPAPPA